MRIRRFIRLKNIGISHLNMFGGIRKLLKVVMSILETSTHYYRRSISSDKLYNLSDENGWSGGILKKCHDNYIIIVTGGVKNGYDYF